jgi:uncharacterized MAPEG superfamily protein
MLAFSLRPYRNCGGPHGNLFVECYRSTSPLPHIHFAGDSFGIVQRQAGVLSGPVLPADDENLLYRIDRVHMNAVEALPPFVVPAVLAMMVGVRPGTLATLVWIYVAIRLIHVVVYLRGGKAAKGGSIRTILYVSGAAVTVILIATTAVAAIG